ncbi:MAG: hypothetical protein U0892_03770 [Pirellulales bacterium]
MATGDLQRVWQDDSIEVVGVTRRILSVTVDSSSTSQQQACSAKNRFVLDLDIGRGSVPPNAIATHK